MFEISDVAIKQWIKKNKPKATKEGISKIEATIKTSLPVPYVEFVTEYGFVLFQNDISGMPCLFDYTVTFPDRKETREGYIAYILNPDRIIKAYDYCTSPALDEEDAKVRPLFPANYLPVGGSADESFVLFDISKTPSFGSVRYWPENEWAWGLEDNTWVGYVANDFYAFINNLRPDPDFLK